LTLDVILFTEDESFASLDNSEALGFGLGALELKHNLLGVLGFLSEDRFGLSSETLLLHDISSITLSKLVLLSSFVLRHLMDGVFLCFPVVCSDCLWDMDHYDSSST
tara:strand:- start:84 stop:404 length:321 start_codon:yes stop_codon:yes gene_type:complete